MALNQVGLERLNTATTDKIGKNKNKIINGGMTVSQRQTSTTNSNAFVVDRFQAQVTQMDELAQTLEQSSDAPDGFGKSIKITTTTPESSIASNEQFRIQTKLEGQDFQDLEYGTSSAKTITISFYVKASITGTFGFTVYRDESTDRVITAPYTISSANTWERKTITIPGDTAGAAITNDNAERFRLMWGLAAGANFNTASPTWGNYSSANLLGGHVTNSLVTTNNATWQLTGVQLEVGSVATDFEHRSFAQELALCYRYFEQYNFTNFSYEAIMPSHNTNTSGGTLGVFPWRAEKRATPTVTLSADSTFRLNGGGPSDVQATSMSISRTGKYTTKIDCNASRSQTQGLAGYISRQNTETTFIQISAEL